MRKFSEPDFTLRTAIRILGGIVSIMLFRCETSWSQGTDSKISPGYYVVIGTFAVKSNALRYRDDVGHAGYKAILTKEMFYYVYLTKCASRDTAVRHADAVRNDFEDVWVKHVRLSSDSASVADSDIKYFSKKDQKILIHLADAKTFRTISGNVAVMGSNDLKFIRNIKANLCDTLTSVSDSITLICDVFGYKKAQQNISLKQVYDSTSGIKSVKDNCLKINFELMPHRSGDIMPLEHVLFYRNSVIMQPESKDELEELAQLLKFNDKMRIRLHGHTNGNHRGKIIDAKALDSFFQVSDSTVSFGSAKSLSFKRANIIKRFLVANAVDASRIEVKAWGGKHALHSEDGNEAHKNMRVEMEVLSE